MAETAKTRKRAKPKTLDELPGDLRQAIAEDIASARRLVQSLTRIGSRIGQMTKQLARAAPPGNVKAGVSRSAKSKPRARKPRRELQPA
jgi:hypothetical protein